MTRLKGARSAMIARAVFALGLIVFLAMAGESLASSPPAGRLRLSLPVNGVLAAEIGGLAFSESVNEVARPISPAVEFGADTMRIWVSFNYYDFKPGTRVRYLIRANGDEWQTGDLTCCDGLEGRYAFPIERERDRAFGGAGYEVVILIGNVEASRGNFQVRGTGGFDNDNCDDESQTHRGNLSSRNHDKC